MSMRLHFKGDKPDKKKKKRSHRHEDEDRGEGSSRRRKSKRDENDSAESDVEDVGGDETAWVLAQRPEDLTGPLLLYQRLTSSSRLIAVTLNPTITRMDLSTLPPPPSLSTSLADLPPEAVEGATIVDSAEGVATGDGSEDAGIGPSSMQQVLVANRVLDTVDPPRFTLRTTQHRFVGADKHGAVLCSAEARGPQEEWAVVSAGYGSKLAFRNHVHGTYLSWDEIAGGKLVLRCDSQDLNGEGDAWSAKVQWKFRHNARKAERAREIGKGGLVGVGKKLRIDQGEVDEASLSKSRQGHSLGKVMTYSSGDARSDRKALKKAQKEGRAAEELLDRRVKMKSDKFA
ncbi:hypothetical protein BDZ90DRAFT_281347 [Jaminaea rosea]|uniref:Actin-crosslinking protein n=1 Tax=Jaminaea rosea TaxID=1569628 RepID=A0A316UKR4_9BASI|nr:hypothetical protein BDZ90DRAFT_281347 [Jaminaea rosea]PWN25524.1 hypothetical protein BDZ90DRAFT_281347 [Jaminaea rosea]